MSEPAILRLGTVKGVGRFKEYLRELGLEIPCDEEIQCGEDSPLLQELSRNGVEIGNRIVVQPMEGWDGEADGCPSELTEKRWRKFGRSGGKLIWGGEAVAVMHEGRANPNQLVMAEHTKKGLAQLRAVLVEEHRKTTGSEKGLLIGLQLTHSGRYSRPNAGGKPESRILYHHPILDRKLGLANDYPLLSDGEIGGIVEAFHRGAKSAQELGFDFVDIKHCHGYLGHEFLSAHTREGKYGGSFENRTRFLREVVEGVRASAPGLKIAVRLSAIDTVAFRPDPTHAAKGKLGPGIPETTEGLVPYRWGFGVNRERPTEVNLGDAIEFLELLEDLEIPLVNITTGSPYYNPHLQRPALYPPSDGYQPPEEPLRGVATQMKATRELKRRFPNLIVVGTAYSYLQEFLPYVAQAAVREGWADAVGLGRILLTYPEILWDASNGRVIEHKRICRTFSDCTTAPRNGMPSGCYPLDHEYKHSEFAARLKVLKAKQ